MSNLKEQLIRLGSSKPSLRKHLRPILDAVTAGYYDIPEGTTAKVTVDVELDLRAFEKHMRTLGDTPVSDELEEVAYQVGRDIERSSRGIEMEDHGASRKGFYVEFLLPIEEADYIDAMVEDAISEVDSALPRMVKRVYAQ